MNWKTFKEMSKERQIKWLLHYYSLPFLAVVVIIGVSMNYLYRVFGPHEEALVKVIILDDRCSDENRLAIDAELREALGVSSEVTAYQKSVEYQFQGFVVRVAGDDLDFVIAPENEIQELQKNGYFTEILQLDENARYYQLVDPEGYCEEKDLYMGITGNREIDETILQNVKEYFLKIV